MLLNEYSNDGFEMMKLIELQSSIIYFKYFHDMLG